MHPAQAVAEASGGYWEIYRDESGVHVVANEIGSASENPYEQRMLRAEVRHLMKEALLGRLEVEEHIKKIQSDPLLYELRWEIGAPPDPMRLWRLYFGWHRAKGPLRLGLKFGEKPHGPTGWWVQNQHIAEAGRRHKVWYRRQYP